MKIIYPTLILSLLAPAAFAGDAAKSSAPNDAEIAQIVLTANRNEVDAGKTAKKMTKNLEVKELADMMITEHSSVADQTKDVAKKNKLKPTDSVASKDMQKEAKENAEKLKGMKGTDFDREYVNQMVAAHQAVLDSIDQTLLPNAKNEDLKALLMKVRPAVATHLQHAKALQEKLGSATNAG